MKKHIPFVLAFLCIANFTYAQKEKRDHSDFDGVSLGVPAKLIITQGDRYSVELSGDNDDLEEIRTEVRGSTLVIRSHKEWGWFHWESGNNVTIYVTMKDIRSLSVSGSGTIENEGRLHTGNLDLEVSGSGKIDVVAESQDVSVDISGSGSVRIEGKGNDGEVDISGSGKLIAEDFQSDSFDIEISGSGRCTVNVTRSIYADISGSGSVYYKGDPDKVRSNVSGSGRVRKY